MKFAVAFAAMAALTSASPVTPYRRGGFPSLRDLQCLLVSDVNSLLSKVNGGSSNSFCSSFIASTTTTTKSFTTTSVTTTTAVVPVTASTTVTTTAATPTVTAYVYSDCGQPGYNLNSTAYIVDTSGTLGTFAACSARCAVDSTCLSFAVGNNNCLLFLVRVAGNLNPVATSPFIFYDRNCPASSVPVAPSSSTPAAPTKRSAERDEKKGSDKQDKQDKEEGDNEQGSAAMPTAFSGQQAAKISAVCSCLITKASTKTVTVSSTTTIRSTAVIATSVVVTTNVSVSTITPAPTTVTVTTTV